MKIEPKRCAIYTRKSHDEGLEQDYNSLDAQRDAAMNYIASQRSNGWQALPESYDDGGWSGGNINRPALQRMMTDLRAGLIDIVVVYKIDRLSRSLTDFAVLQTEHSACSGFVGTLLSEEVQAELYTIGMYPAKSAQGRTVPPLCSGEELRRNVQKLCAGNAERELDALFPAVRSGAK